MSVDFSKDVLKIDPEKVSRKIEEFIRNTVRKSFKRKGIVIGLSGGLDSSVSAALAVRALGARWVYGLILPEKDSHPVSRTYGRLVAESLNIEYDDIDITPMLKSLGVYDKRDTIVKAVFPELDESYKFRLVLPQDLLERDRLNVYSLEVLLEDGTIRRKRLSHNNYFGLMAANDIKQRVRMIHLYYEAEKRHCVVCGTTNRSEMMQGFFVKYGDGGVDIEPIAGLYKSQVYQVGRYLDIPKEILTRTPTPDTYSFEVSDKEFYFCIPFDILDLFLYAIEHNVQKTKVANTLDLTMEQVNRIWKDMQHKYDTTAYLRQFPPSPEV